MPLLFGEASTVFRKIVTTIVVVPLAAVIIAFAVANRQAVTVSFDPFSATAPAYAATLPLFAVIFTVLILGVLIGGFTVWLGQSKWRRAARKREAELRSLQQEIDLKNARDGYRSQPEPSTERPLQSLSPPTVP